MKRIATYNELIRKIRRPMAGATSFFKDYSKYSRKRKHKNKDG